MDKGLTALFYLRKNNILSNKKETFKKFLFQLKNGLENCSAFITFFCFFKLFKTYFKFIAVVKCNVE